MILGFKQKFANGEPTNFREKILAGIGYIPKDVENMPKNGQGILHLLEHPKIHTFRTDPLNRWKPGMSIQMVYRGPKYSILDHFNKDIPELQKCMSVQKIKLWITGSLGEFKEDGKREQIIQVHAIVDNKRLDQPELLVLNDGFDSTYQFATWFKQPWEGKIIHWTDYRY